MIRVALAAFAIGLVVSSCSDEPTSAPTPTTIPVTVATTTTAAPSTTTPPPATSTTATPAETTTTTRTPASLATLDVDVAPVADGFAQPIFATSRPGDTRLYVADQVGSVYSLDLTTGEARRVLAIDERVRFSGEQGLLGIAFHPDDPDRLVVHYNDENTNTVVAEFRLDADDPESTEKTILTVDQPATNHNGGMVAFGPDGYLYVALGDGGGVDDQFDQGQDPFTLLGTIVRIDIDTGDPYAIPPDNPFADGVDGAPEVWAWGLRNPWRFSIDGDDIWVGDVGQATIEEITVFDIGRGGDNAGWPLLEGTRCFRVEPCDIPGLLAPITEYVHESGRCSVTGGVVYRGTAIPDLIGAYLYGDFCSGEVWALRGEEQRLLTDDRSLPRLPGLTSFGTGPDGEVYLMQTDGVVSRLIPAG